MAARRANRLSSAVTSQSTSDACSIGGWTGKSFESEQEYIVLRNNTEKVTVFAFRGTQPTSILDWLRDSDFTPHSVTINGMTVWLHSGFQRRFQDIAEDIKKELATTHAEHTVIMTGHSLGAAVATVGATYFYAWGRSPDAVITFASPLTGNGDFRDMYQYTLGCDATLRIAVKEDPVPDVPKVYGYTHVCDTSQYSYGSSNILKVHDLYLAYHDAIVSQYGAKASAANVACTVSGQPQPLLYSGMSELNRDEYRQHSPQFFIEP